jgi:hypothetical protein
MFKNNYNSCIGRSNENICSSNGGAQEKERHPEIQFITKIDDFLSFTPSNVYVFFSG